MTKIILIFTCLTFGGSLWLLNWNQIQISLPMNSDKIIETRALEERRIVMEMRRHLLRKTCDRYAISKDSVKNETLDWNILMDLHHNLAFCPIGKSGSTTWMSYFLV